MPDVNAVIEGLEHCRHYTICDEECPYSVLDGTCKRRNYLLEADAIQIMQEQEQTIENLRKQIELLQRTMHGDGQITDFGKILSDIVGMASYFMGCKANAGDNTKARKQFTQYIKTLEALSDVVQDMIDYEDDGK